MHRADLTPTELADILHRAYLTDLGDDVDAPGPSLRASLADYLGCHPAVRTAAWEAWQESLDDAGINPDDAEYWLDVEFIEPCPEDQGED